MRSGNSKNEKKQECIKNDEWKFLSMLVESATKDSKKRKGFDTLNVDRISYLPEPIIHHILSFLQCRKDAARTSILSKRWRRIWISYFGLAFDQRKFEYEVQLRGQVQGDKKTMFRDFIDQSMQSHIEEKSGMQRFRLGLSYDSELAPRMDRWLGIAVENDIKELELHVANGKNRHYSLPPAVLASKSITYLRLYGCKWKASSDIKFSNLKWLYCRELHLTDQKIQNLVSSCPVIEDMRFIHCNGLQNLQVSSFKLYRVEVHQCHGLKKIELEAPKLRTFSYHGKKSMLCNINLAACKSLKVLTLDDPEMTDISFQNLLSDFPVLEILDLSRCNHLQNIKISSVHLKKIVLRGCKNLINADIDTPNLRSFEYKGNKLPFSSLNPFGLEEAKLHCHYKDSEGMHPGGQELWFSRIGDFLKKLNPSKGLKLVVRSESNRNIIIHEDLTEILLPGFNDIKMDLVKSSTSPVELFDSLLESYQPNILTIVSPPGSKFPKLVYDSVWNREEYPGCCWDKTIKCWRHHMNGVKNQESTADWVPWLYTFPAEVQEMTAFRFHWGSCRIREGPQEQI